MRYEIIPKETKPLKFDDIPKRATFTHARMEDRDGDGPQSLGCMVYFKTAGGFPSKAEGGVELSSGVYYEASRFGNDAMWCLLEMENDIVFKEV